MALSFTSQSTKKQRYEVLSKLKMLNKSESTHDPIDAFEPDNGRCYLLFVTVRLCYTSISLEPRLKARLARNALKKSKPISCLEAGMAMWPVR